MKLNRFLGSVAVLSVFLGVVSVAGAQTTPAPTISYVQEPTGDNNIVRSGDGARVFGTGFSLNSVVVVYFGGYAASGQTNADGSQVSFTVPTIPAGSYAVSVGDHVFNSNAVITTVLSVNTAPIITSFSSNQGTAGNTIAVYGTNFAGVSEVDFYNQSGQFVANITSPAMTLQTPTQLSFSISDVFSANMIPGLYQVKIKSSTGASNALSFTLIKSLVSLTTAIVVTPTQGTAGDIISVYGTNFNGATEVDFYNQSGQMVAGISSPLLKVQDNKNLSFTISSVFSANMISGLYQIKVVAPAGTSNALPFTLVSSSAITSTATAPTISSIYPNQAPADASVRTAVTIYGTNLTGASAINFYSTDISGPDGTLSSSLPTSNFTVASDGKSLSFVITGAFAVNVASGSLQIRVVTSSGTSNAILFTMVTPSTSVPTVTAAPAISSIYPQYVQVGSPLTVYFVNGGSTGSILIKTVDGLKSWHVPYTTGTVYNGFVYYDGTKVTFTVPAMIGRGQLPENSGYETPIPITYGVYNLYVYRTGSSINNAFQIYINPSANTSTLPSNTSVPATGGTLPDPELQRQINALLDQVRVLQGQSSQLPAAQTSNTPASTSAQSDNAPTSSGTSCIALSDDFGYRARDAATNGGVSTLQDFLQSRGVLNSEPTGFFGSLTTQAVKSFQRINGMNPTGYVGPLTRAKIKALTCGQ